MDGGGDGDYGDYDGDEDDDDGDGDDDDDDDDGDIRRTLKSLEVEVDSGSCDSLMEHYRTAKSSVFVKET